MCRKCQKAIICDECLTCYSCHCCCCKIRDELELEMDAIVNKTRSDSCPESPSPEAPSETNVV